MSFVEIIDVKGQIVFGRAFDSLEEAKDCYNMLTQIDLKLKVRLVDDHRLIKMDDNRECASVDEILSELEDDEYVILCDKEGTPYISGNARELQLNLYSRVLDRKAVKTRRKIKIFKEESK